MSDTETRHGGRKRRARTSLSSQAPPKKRIYPTLSEEQYHNLRRVEGKFQEFKEPPVKAMKYWRPIIDWMRNIGDDLELITLTVHIAVKLFSRVLAATEVCKKRVPLVSITCLFMAAKYEELPDNIPRLDHILRYLPGSPQRMGVNADLIRDMEVMILKVLKWRLGVVVPLHFFQFHLSSGIVFPLDSQGGQPLAPQVVRDVRKYIDFFVDLYQQEHDFQKYLPSLMSCAVIACARFACHIDTQWTHELQKTTGYTWAKVQPCFDHLYKYYRTCFPPTEKKIRPPAPVTISAPSTPVPCSPSSPTTPCTPATPMTPLSDVPNTPITPIPL
jgi:hypothetical protein